MFRLDGKVALVTGASRGIGRAIAEGLAEQGATAIVNFAKNEAAAREVVDGIVAKGGKAEMAGFDVAQTEAAEAAIADLAKKHGRLDVLVANAGIAIDGLLLRVKAEDIERTFAINVSGAIACARAATRVMMRAKTGRIIFLSSVVGEAGNVGQTVYSASKGAILSLTKTLAREYASRNVTVNAITPGFIETDMTQGIAAEMREAMLKGIPLGRMGSAREVAACAAFLASDDASYVTGHVLRVNGGMYM